MTDIQTKGRTILLSVWFVFFLLNGGIILLLYLKGWIERDNLIAGLKEWNAAYAPYLGAVTLFYWGRAQQSAAGQAARTKTAFVLALLASLLWNGLVFAFFLPPLRGSGSIETALQNIREIASLFSWLASGAIGYYFAQPGERSV